MTIKTLSAIAIVTAALSAPVFAQDTDMQGAGPQKPVHALRHYRSTYNQAPAFMAPRKVDRGHLLENESYDRSRIGSHDADFNPGG